MTRQQKALVASIDWRNPSILQANVDRLHSFEAENEEIAKKVNDLESANSSKDPKVSNYIQEMRADLQATRADCATLEKGAKDLVEQAKHRYPMNFSRTDDFGSFHMITNGQVSEQGVLNVRTETSEHTALRGDCGTVAVWLVDSKGNWLYRAGGQQYCVDGKYCFICSSSDSYRRLEWKYST